MTSRRRLGRSLAHWDEGGGIATAGNAGIQAWAPAAQRIAEAGARQMERPGISARRLHASSRVRAGAQAEGVCLAAELTCLRQSALVFASSTADEPLCPGDVAWHLWAQMSGARASVRTGQARCRRACGSVLSFWRQHARRKLQRRKNAVACVARHTTRWAGLALSRAFAGWQQVVVGTNRLRVMAARMRSRAQLRRAVSTFCAWEGWTRQTICERVATCRAVCRLQRVAMSRVLVAWRGLAHKSTAADAGPKTTQSADEAGIRRREFGR